MKVTSTTTGICLLSSPTIVCGFQYKIPTVGRTPTVRVRLSAGTDLPNEDAGDDVPIVAKSTVKIDDGGSDLTDRFKYKMQALLGNFDPQMGEDTEADGQGNIISALTNFPARFAFTVVGRTNGDDEAKEAYIEQVKKIVGETSGSANTLECRVTPRGTNFVRVSVEVTVESGAIINSIYEELSEVEATVMKY
mmetsp:Transcript_10578/g.29730  ORF Transcript_10578/g.29730 Transcript_10578/m.29730 type:complete len:193 (+) Transcript_10578:199-777(+)